MRLQILPFEERHRRQIVALSLRVWRPVFEKFQPAVPAYVFDALYPRGWEVWQAGVTMAMVETGDDPGHAAARATYERYGFERWPVARYFRKL